MKKLYALALSVVAAVMLLGSFSTANAQSYTLADMTVRTIPNNFQEISGTEITNLRGQYGYYIGPSGTTITSPFSIRRGNFITNQMRVSGNATCYLYSSTNPGGQIGTGIQYNYNEQYASYNYSYSYDYSGSGGPVYNYGPYQYGNYWTYPSYDYGSYGYGFNYAYVPYICPIGYPTTFNGTPSNVKYTTRGSAPNREFVVQVLYRLAYPYSYINGYVNSTSVGSWQTVFTETPTSIPTKVQYFYRLDNPGGN